MKSICEAKPLDEYNDTVDKVILVQRIAQSPKAIIALLAENRRLAREKVEAECLLRKLVTQLDIVHSDADYLATWQLAQEHRGKYRGASYETEFENARKFLARRKQGAR